MLSYLIISYYKVHKGKTQSSQRKSLVDVVETLVFVVKRESYHKAHKEKNHKVHKENDGK